MPGNYSITTRAAGTVLTAAIYNADHQNHVDNDIPTQMGSYSTSTTQMRTTTDPGEVGTETLATALSGELERMRWHMLEINQALDQNKTQWYETPQGGLTIPSQYPFDVALAAKVFG